MRPGLCLRLIVTRAALGWQMMRKRIPLSQREDYDVLAEFDGNEDTADDSAFLKDRGKVARSAGLTLGLMILTAIAFAVGVGWGASQDLNVAPGNALWDLVIHIGFAVGAGLLAIGLKRHASAVGLLFGSRADALIRSSPVPILSVPMRPE